MTRLFTHPNPMLVGYLRGVLESEGIRCHVRNEYLAGALGELPPTAIWPELWLLDEADLARARRILHEVLPDVAE